MPWIVFSWVLQEIYIVNILKLIEEWAVLHQNESKYNLEIIKKSSVSDWRGLPFRPLLLGKYFPFPSLCLHMFAAGWAVRESFTLILSSPHANPSFVIFLYTRFSMGKDDRTKERKQHILPFLKKSRSKKSLNITQKVRLKQSLFFSWSTLHKRFEVGLFIRGRYKKARKSVPLNSRLLGVWLMYNR